MLLRGYLIFSLATLVHLLVDFGARSSHPLRVDLLVVAGRRDVSRQGALGNFCPSHCLVDLWTFLRPCGTYIFPLGSLVIIEL